MYLRLERISGASVLGNNKQFLKISESQKIQVGAKIKKSTFFTKTIIVSTMFPKFSIVAVALNLIGVTFCKTS